MPIDPSIPLQVQPLKLESPVNQLTMMNEALKYGEMNRSIDTQNKLRELYSQGTDISTPEGFKQIAAVDPMSAIKLRTQALEGRKLQSQVDTSEFNLKNNKINTAITTIANLHTPEEAATSIAKQVESGDIPPERGQQLMQHLKTVPFTQFKTDQLTGILSAKDNLSFTTLNANQKASLAQADSHFQQRLAQETATGALTPETTDLLAQTYIKTGQMPPLGMGKAATVLRQSVLNRAAQISMGGGANPDGTAKPNVSAEDAASNIVQNKSSLIGNRASERTLGTNLANIVAAGSEAEKMINIAQTYATKINPTDYPVINTAGNYIAKNSGDPTQAGLATSLNSLVNAYARAINPKGVATVSDKNHAREVINTNMASGQFNEVFSVMRQEMAAAQAAPEEARAKIRNTSGKETITAKKISNDVDYNALPSGVEFIAPDGSHRRKP